MASKGINKVIIVGNLGNDPDARFMPAGGAVTQISVATSESWKDKTSGQQQERTEWHRVIFYNRLAEIAGEYLKKGSKVYLEGSLRTRKWQDKSGADKYTTEIIASEMQMLDSRNQNGDSLNSQANTQSDRKDQSSAAEYRAASGGDSPPQGQPQPQNFDDFDDDIPF